MLVLDHGAERRYDVGLARGEAERYSAVGTAMRAAILAGLIERGNAASLGGVAIAAAVASGLATVANVVLLVVR